MSAAGMPARAAGRAELLTQASRVVMVEMAALLFARAGAHAAGRRAQPAGGRQPAAGRCARPGRCCPFSRKRFSVCSLTWQLAEVALRG